ncbi:MAG: ABC transporter permease subunit [Planctomycetota bacterium]
MKGFVACFLAELGDLTRMPLVWLAALGTVATAVVVGLGPAGDAANGWLVYEAALSASAQAAGFFLLGIAAMAIASDRTRGTIRWILPRPLTRRGYVLGKASAILLLTADLLLLSAISSYLVAQPKGFGDVVAMEQTEVVTEGFDFVEEEIVPEEFKADAMRGRAWSATLRLLPALLLLAGLGLLVSALLRSAAGAVIAAIGVALPMHFLPELFGLSEKTARIFPQHAARAALEQLHEYGMRHSGLQWPEYTGTTGVVAACFAVGLPAIAALVFSRLDITD